MKASEIRDYLDQIDEYEKTATNEQKSKILLKKIKLKAYLNQKYKNFKQLDENFVAGSDDSYDYDLNISQAEEQEIQQTLSDIYDQFQSRFVNDKE